MKRNIATPEVARRRGILRISALLVVVAAVIAVAKWPDDGRTSGVASPVSSGSAPDSTVDPLIPVAAPPRFEDAITGEQIDDDSVSTNGNLSGDRGDMFLAAVSSKPARAVVGISGMGLEWFPVRAQCSGRGTTQVELWVAHATDAAEGEITASLSRDADSLVVAVARYSGVDAGTPLGAVAGSNTNADPELCDGGVDQSLVSTELDRVDPASQLVIVSALRQADVMPAPTFESRTEVSAGEGGGVLNVVMADILVTNDGFGLGQSSSGASEFSARTSSETDWAAIAVELLPDGYAPEAASLSLSDDRLEFGPVDLGRTTRRDVTLRNEGRADLSISDIAVVGPDADQFHLVGATSVVLGRDESLDVQIEFRPVGEGNASGRLEVASDVTGAGGDGMVVQLTGRAGPAPDGIWISPAELAALPTTGPAWDDLVAAADGDLGVADVSAFVDRHDVLTLAVALVAARTGDQQYLTKARDAIMSAIGTEDGTTDAVQPCRNVPAYVLAADIIRLGDLDPAADRTFRAWIDGLRDVEFPNGSLVQEDTQRANNHGRMCGAARVVIGRYLGDDADVAEAAQTFAHMLGDTSVGREFVWDHDLSWQADPRRPVGVNPVGAIREGLDIGGALPEEMRRGAPFALPPVYTSYPWEALQAIVLEAVVLDRAGYDVFDWSDQAILRSVDFMARLDQAYPDAGWWAQGDDSWLPWMINDIYGTTLRTSPAGAGKNMGWTDWTHAPVG